VTTAGIAIMVGAITTRWWSSSIAITKAKTDTRMAPKEAILFSSVI
jgi:hypothetical protein